MSVILNRSPSVSIVVPVFNTEQYLLQCLESLAEQSLSSIEVIVVIDASPDNAYQLAKQFAEQSNLAMRIVNLTTNVGLAQARNIGMSHAKGQYLGFVDSDDYVDKQMYSHLFNQAVANNADWVSCGFSKFSAQGIEQYAHSNISENTSVCNKLFRRSFIHQHQICFPAGELFEDEIFSYMAELYAQTILHIENPYYFYRHNANGICRKPGADKSRLYARMCSIGDFMQRMEQSELLPSAAPLCLEMLCRHAYLQLRTQVSWFDLLCYWRFTQHLIEKYQLAQSIDLVKDNYFVSSFNKWQHREWALWLIRLRAGRANYAVE
ncbi:MULTISPECIES: glycosyltransferase family 2 protein [unclassified Agarivorans]|uniref:glycosyltransferase family 2 protein n=1 Tax=unclassified Agarivorans TaxID=2636026 RepID=UPI0026E476E3|nr:MULTISPECIES: glycosyltransferase family 2 protein [unclassified Agarivorans]MDO6686300.1 glycosyltransferase family 2 protein [Agarivorans sp. 3_MG-2023]MDO6713602.1 glycosyltransferase family 2 protein [Agarivorans sp. 2_MG-2023]